MIIVIDNNDSFTYNLIDYIKTETSHCVEVLKVTEVTVALLEELIIGAIVISPGPGKPSDYPILKSVLDRYASSVPILGICLGFQLIYEYYGGEIIHGPKPVHGHTTPIIHTGKGLFKHLPQNFNVMRYHSLIANRQQLPSQLNTTATNNEGIMMAFEHDTLPIFAVQYHPESILSEYGHQQIQYFIEKVGKIHEYYV